MEFHSILQALDVIMDSDLGKCEDKGKCKVCFAEEKEADVSSIINYPTQLKYCILSIRKPHEAVS